jgi:transposase-like protein
MQEQAQPLAGEDYPGTWSQFLEWFPDDAACARYLERLRWRGAFACPGCGVLAEPYRASRGRLMCTACGHQASVSAGTIFDKTRTPLTVWFAAAWYVTSQKHGVSALGLQRVLGLGSYQTAWTLMHRFRRAMVRPERERLGGTVQVDETYVALGDREFPFVPKSLSRKRETGKLLVVMAVEMLEPTGIGRIRLRRIPAAAQVHVQPFIEASVDPSALVHTDGSMLYSFLDRAGYQHKRTIVQDVRSRPIASLPAVNRVASLLQRWLLGTHHGAVQPGQLDHYLDEFVFRFNRRRSRSRGLLFYRLLEQAVQSGPITYRDIVDSQTNPAPITLDWS